MLSSYTMPNGELNPIDFIFRVRMKLIPVKIHLQMYEDFNKKNVTMIGCTVVNYIPGQMVNVNSSRVGIIIVITRCCRTH